MIQSRCLVRPADCHPAGAEHRPPLELEDVGAGEPGGGGRAGRRHAHAGVPAQHLVLDISSIVIIYHAVLLSHWHRYHVITLACGDLNMLRVLPGSGSGRLGAELPCMWPAPEREHCQLQRPPPHGDRCSGKMVLLFSSS